MSRRKKAPKKSHIGVVLDRSGSMQSMALETEQGFDRMIEKTREGAEGDTYVTLVQFDTDIDTVYSQRHVNDVPKCTLIPRGGTSLFDGIGEAIRRMEKFVRKGDNVLITIMTDGGENSSQEYHKKTINELMDSKRKDGWDFNFLGAGPAAWQGAEMLGIRRDFAINYAGNPVQQDAAFAAVAASNVAKTRGLESSYTASALSLKTELENDTDWVPDAQAGVQINIAPQPLGKPIRRRGSGKNLK